ncbi:hypothetical protein QJS10_CPA05g00854 [Acorus calamus]|uniref:Dynamin N-terminal domain-containing protein n=1 Tax=Acorus calamus TaxID=4465 RepID=A0AAV9EXY1_ACOCL|nr:hypothetical protein QJS10_CPA05g00854 [Acorus calamus]
MVSIFSSSTASIGLLNPPTLLPKPHFPSSDRPSHRRRRKPLLRLRPLAAPLRPFNAVTPDAEPRKQQQQQRQTLFPGGLKRPEIKVPGLAIRVNADEVLVRRDDALLAVDLAVSKGAGVVVLDGGADGSGGRLYEAACALRSVIRDRAYLLVSERVDIAAVVEASGVVLSDQDPVWCMEGGLGQQAYVPRCPSKGKMSAGLPAIVARKMMMKAKSGSVLPLVARTVHSAESALIASSSDGADLLIYVTNNGKSSKAMETSFVQHVRVPVFSVIDLLREETPFSVALNLIQSGASGIVISLDDVKLLNDDLCNLFSTDRRMQNKFPSSSELPPLDVHKDNKEENLVAGFTKLDERMKQFIEAERMVLVEAIAAVRKASPMMEEISLLEDAVSRLDEPFLLVVVGEFNSGKSTVINALLGRKYLNEGVVPTTNEITLLCYSEMESDAQERCERHPDGQFICYLPAPILKEMNLVDTPGTNVILQRQQRLTEEFVPRADLLLFIISADRPLTESELEEATAFIIENACKLLNTECVTLYPVSARSALKAKLSVSSSTAKGYEESLSNHPHWNSSRFYELEKFLFSFLDGSTDNGMERMRLKLETPIGIAERLHTACVANVQEEYDQANVDLNSIKEIISSVEEYAWKMENESILWKKRTSSLIEAAKARSIKLIESTLQISNVDLVASYALQGEKSDPTRATSAIQNEIISPALSDAKILLEEYSAWLQSNNAREGKLYQVLFENRWPSYVKLKDIVPTETYDLLCKGENLSMKVTENFSAGAAAKLFEQELREVIQRGIENGLKGSFNDDESPHEWFERSAGVDPASVEEVPLSFGGEGGGGKLAKGILTL